MDLKIRKAELLTLEDMRKNARVDDPGEDDSLMLCAAAAEEAILGYLYTSWIELLDTYGHIPAAIYKAMLACATQFYNLPEDTDTRPHHEVPMGIRASIEQYKRLSDRNDV